MFRVRVRVSLMEGLVLRVRHRVTVRVRVSLMERLGLRVRVSPMEGLVLGLGCLGLDLAEGTLGLGLRLA